MAMKRSRTDARERLACGDPPAPGAIRRRPLLAEILLIGAALVRASPGRPGALLRPAPLRTGRASFPASGSSKP